MTPQLIPQRARGGIHLQIIRGLLDESDVVKCRGIVAFATLNGVLLLTDQLAGGIKRFLARGGALDWLIGVDAVTTGDALKELRRLMVEKPASVRVRSYSSQDNTLFHPKILIFGRRNGSSTAIVGSSNLTKGGLVDNAEVSVRIELTARQTASWMSALDDFVATPGAIVPITDDLIAQLSARARATARTMRRVAPPTTESESDASLAGARVLVQLAPMSGGRPSQLGIRADTMASFFGLRPGVARRVRLQQVQPNARAQPVEPLRPLVFPEGSNRNSRIEVSGLRHVAMTATNRPIVVFEQLGGIRFRYLILVPGDDGYDELHAHLATLPKTRSMPHNILTIEALLAIWPAYPI